MSQPNYTSFTPITNSSTQVVNIPQTAGLLVAVSGVVAVGGVNGPIVNCGTLPAGTQLDGWCITRVGTANTATLIALR